MVKPYFQAVFARKDSFRKSSPSHFGYCPFASLCKKSGKTTNEPIPRKADNRKMVKGNFPKKRKSVSYDEKTFSRKNFFGHIIRCLALSFCQKSEKLMKQFCISPSHFWYCHFASLCKKSERNNEAISRKSGNIPTNEQTNGQRLIYMTWFENMPKRLAKGFKFFNI